VAKQVEDLSEFATGVLRVAREKNPLTEDQLFWMAKIAEDHLLDSDKCPELLERLYTHDAATQLTKAKVLEIPHVAMNDMRDEFLKGGRSDWLAWSSAIGSRELAKSKRNHLLKYFGKASPMNAIIGGCVRQI